MPTGYTDDLTKGKPVTFREFALKCARAIIGPCDGPLDAPIPDEFQPGNYHLATIERFKKILAEVEAWSDVQAETEAKKSFDSQVRQHMKHMKYTEKIEKIGLAHLDMLKQVHEWIPPTKDHEKLKNFMIQQLTDSRLQLTLNAPHEVVPQWLPGKEYRTQLITEMRRIIADSTERHDAEVRVTGEKNDWMRALRHSLNGSR